MTPLRVYALLRHAGGHLRRCRRGTTGPTGDDCRARRGLAAVSVVVTPGRRVGRRQRAGRRHRGHGVRSGRGVPLLFEAFLVSASSKRYRTKDRLYLSLSNSVAQTPAAEMCSKCSDCCQRKRRKRRDSDSPVSDDDEDDFSDNYSGLFFFRYFFLYTRVIIRCAPSKSSIIAVTKFTSVLE